MCSYAFAGGPISSLLVRAVPPLVHALAGSLAMLASVPEAPIPHKGPCVL